jgi:thiamine biosynthesis lipoprotein
VLFPLACVAAGLFAAAGPSAAREVRLVMGAPAEVSVSGAPDPGAALTAAFAALQRVDDEMTLWRPSPLARLNAAGGARVSAGLLAVIARALEVARDSGGAFDPTVEPLVRAAGKLGDPARSMDGRERRRTLRRVGAANVRLDPGRGAVRLLHGARLDLGGIAKGYAADLALAALQAAGARAGLVDLGGSSLAVFGEGAAVAIADPGDRANAPWGSFRLEGAALGTSGTAERGAHILDPRTGEPAARVLSATVVAASGMEADALSTALFVLGRERGLALLARRGASGFVLEREEGRSVMWTTPGFARAHALQAAPGVLVREAP